MFVALIALLVAEEVTGLVGVEEVVLPVLPAGLVPLRHLPRSVLPFAVCLSHLRQQGRETVAETPASYTPVQFELPLASESVIRLRMLTVELDLEARSGASKD